MTTPDSLPYWFDLTEARRRSLAHIRMSSVAARLGDLEAHAKGKRRPGTPEEWTDYVAANLADNDARIFATRRWAENLQRAYALGIAPAAVEDEEHGEGVNYATQ